MKGYRKHQVHNGHNDPLIRFILRRCGVKRIHIGWYTIRYNGATLEDSTIAFASRNPEGRVVNWKRAT